MGNYRSRRVEPNEVTVVCYEDHINCDWFCTGFLHFCTKDIQFNSYTACNHQGLINLVAGGSTGSGSANVKTKFSNINQELKRSNTARCTKKPICWTIPFWILFAAVLGVALYFRNVHELQCKAGKVCLGGNSTHAQNIQCPSTSDRVVGCCYAFCDGCNPVSTINDKIRFNRPFKPECNCREVEEFDETRKVCGKIKLYGNFKHLPGDYASPLVTNMLFGLCASTFIILTSVTAIWGRHKSKIINGVLNNCLKDWILLGIAIEYHAGRHYDDTEEYVPGHLILRLPSAQVVPIPPMYPLTESNQTTNGFLYN